MGTYLRKQQGVSLLEMVVLITILGIALPALMRVITGSSQSHARNKVKIRCVNLADSRMEQILGFKNEHWDWWKKIEKFQAVEIIDNAYSRRTTVKRIQKWGDAKIEAFQVTVTVRHPELPRGYTLVLRLSKYH